MDTLLRHPFTLLVTGAMLSGLIIPLITRDWQNRQKSLEIKTGLVAEISEAVMEFFMSIQFVHIRKEIRSNPPSAVTPQEQAEFDQAYKAWEVRSAVIGTKLQAYFPESNLSKKWTAFSDVLTRFYALEGIAEPQLPGSMLSLANRISATLSYALPESATYLQLREAILQSKADIISAVLQTRISLR
jgi:hypothetical protein